MREIKFRGKVKSELKSKLTNNEWVCGSLQMTETWNVKGECNGMTPYITKGVMTEWQEVNAETVGQYTGLNDKNGKEIYEGNIIQALNRKYDCEDEREAFFQKFEVTYLNGCCMFGNWNAHEFFNRFIHKEIIGNIYENKDLLEK